MPQQESCLCSWPFSVRHFSTSLPGEMPVSSMVCFLAASLKLELGKSGPGHVQAVNCRGCSSVGEVSLIYLAEIPVNIGRRMFGEEHGRLFLSPAKHA
jgi:hypothetical protein